MLRSTLEIGKRIRIAKEVKTLENMDGVYQIGHPAQLDSRTVAVGLNIRCCGVNAIDLEVGNDIMFLRDLEHPEEAEIKILDRPSEFINPLRGEKELLAHYPKNIGFVPLGARLADGTPHPFAGTGFVMGQVMGFPLERLERSDTFSGIAPEKRFYGLEITQCSYDGKDFVLKKGKLCRISEILPSFLCGGGSVGPIIPDGEGLMMAFSGCPDNGDNRICGCGILRWKNIQGEWKPVAFDQVYLDRSKFETLNDVTGNFIEPTVVRMRDGTLLYSAREVGDRPFRQGPHEAERLHVWKSRDDGKTWDLCFCEPHFHTLTPSSLDISADGRPFVIANGYCTVNSKGEKLSSIVLRESLLLHPLKEDLSDLEAPLTIQEGRDFGPPPHGSFWRIDLPVGMTLQLKGEIRHLIFYRVLEHQECNHNAMPTDHTGCYAAEVRSTGPVLPLWNF